MEPRINALAGAVLGMILGIGIVLLLTWMESDLLRTPAAAERALGVPVLAAIPRNVKNKEAAQPTTQAGRLGAPKTA